MYVDYLGGVANFKLAYWGPGCAGKQTSLRTIFRRAPESRRGQLVTTTTLYEALEHFDFEPLPSLRLAGRRVRAHLYCKPAGPYGRCFDLALLKGVDGLILMFDARPDRMDENHERALALEYYLEEAGRALAELPAVVQYTMLDQPDAVAVEELERQLNRERWSSFCSHPGEGRGVVAPVHELLRRVIARERQRRHSRE